MRKTFITTAIFFLAINTSAQNVGVATPNPGSTLSVNGSFGTTYKVVSSNYTLTANDYYVLYRGSSPGVITLPPALPEGSGNFKGRMYRIKNDISSCLCNLSIIPSGNEIITAGSIILPFGSTVELISTGLTAGITWEVVNISANTYESDGIRAALTKGGCGSCTSYSIAPNGWVRITAAEYNSILANVSGTATYGATSAQLNSSTHAGLTGGNTYTENFSNQTLLPASNYPVALAIKTGASNPVDMTGIRLKLSSASQTSGYANLGLAVPNWIDGPTLQTIYYYAYKHQINTSPSNGPSNMALFTPAVNQLGFVTGTGFCYFGAGDVQAPNNPYASSIPAFQVIATPVRQW